MSEVNSIQSGVATESGSKQQPAVGLLATATNANDVVGAILRAREHGHEPILTAPESDLEALEFAQQLGVQVVEPAAPSQTTEDLWSMVATAARRQGYPGLIRHSEVTRRIDFDATAATLTETDDYATAPVLHPRTSSRPEVLVAIPAYNEGTAIADVVSAALAHADEVVVIDDGSSDDTVENATAAGATVIEHETNEGYGRALKTAFTEAERCGAEHLVILDGDGQHDPADIPALVESQLADGTEIVIGSRFEEQSETDLPLYRRAGLRVVNVLTNLSLGVVRKRSRIGDTQSGFRAYNRTAIESLAADDEIGNHMSASTDILYHAHRHGYEVQEVGTTIDYDVDNASSQNPVSHGMHLVSNILRTVERERPVTVLGVPGFASAVVGVGFAYLTFSNFINTGTFPLGLALISVFFALAGIFATFTAIILHSLETHLN